VGRNDDEVSDDVDSRETAEHPELERAYDSERGGQVPEDQAEDREYRRPDPGRDDALEGGERHSPKRGGRESHG
jgi:hypothetical protein